MAVDMESRRIIRDGIRAFRENEIDNFQFDDILWHCETDDGLCNSIIDALWYFYDDCKKHYFRDHLTADSAAPAYLRRWQSLLYTTIDFDQPQLARVMHAKPRRVGIWGKVNDMFYGRRPGFASNPFWPLTNAAEWESLGIAYETQSAADHFPKCRVGEASRR